MMQHQKIENKITGLCWQFHVHEIIVFLHLEM